MQPCITMCCSYKKILCDMQNDGAYGTITYGRYSQDNEQYADAWNAVHLRR
jgi:hypothetical protein